MLVICFLFSFFSVFSFLFWVLYSGAKRGRLNFNAMMYQQIRCYHEVAAIPPFSFFILCKGCNAGKPALPLGGAGGGSPWANSFIIVCPQQQYFDFYFWLIYGLFQSGKFKVRHRGSAIPFINLNESVM